MPNHIQTYILSIEKLPAFLSDHFIQKFEINEEYSQNIIEKKIRPELAKLKKNIWALVEFPYVDKMYRNTYYHYYASKLNDYERDTTRVSFFDREIKTEMFRDANRISLLQESYLGFLIIRPTLPDVIGRSALSPFALENNSFIACTTSINATANNLKFTVKAFPHASQDGQMITCAETTLWSMLEYFGNKYPDYKPLLPSQIHELLKKFSYKRQLPSDGLTTEQIAFVLREAGFGTMFYSKEKYGSEIFNSVLSTFIESGIPVIGVLKGAEVAHASNIIGRQKDNREEILKNPVFEENTSDLRIIDLNKVRRNYVFIDDNLPPYQLASLDTPASNYTEDKWKDCQLTNIIVPLYHRIYLDPIKARRNFISILKREVFTIDTEPKILRVFLASSRSYKQYIALNEQIDYDTKELILSLRMPKFIWVAEISEQASFAAGEINGILLQDATEPSKFVGNFQKMSVFCGLYKNEFFDNLHKTLEIIEVKDSPFKKYIGNLS